MTATEVRSGIDLRHLTRLTDETSIFEHARGAIPRREHGYCSDDAGRALIVVSRSSRADAVDLAEIYLAFLQHMHLGGGRFLLRLGFDRQVMDGDVSDDACGRAINGLGAATLSAGAAHVRDGAKAVFDDAASFRSPWLRSMAHAGLGAAAVLEIEPDHRGASDLLSAAARLIEMATGDDVWPEDRLGYGNALLAECLLAAGRAFDSSRLTSMGLRLLRWLVDHETSPSGHFSFVSAGGAPRTEARPVFDQQPIEAAAMADAAARAFLVTGSGEWLDTIARAAAWFDGENDLGVAMYDRRSGGGFDGLTPIGPNINQGAESTLALLTTRQWHAALLSGGSERQ